MKFSIFCHYLDNLMTLPVTCGRSGPDDALVSLDFLKVLGIAAVHTNLPKPNYLAILAQILCKTRR